jgi:hypothetical protein
LAQPPTPILPTDSSGVTVRLEPHEQQTQFKLGDPITLDLVITAKSSGYAVSMEGNRSNAPQDLVNVTPTDGWLRSVGSQDDGSPEDLGLDPVRIPVMLNRSIVFQQPGYYEITITTGRVTSSVKGIPPGTQFPRWSKTTNAIGVDILPRDEHEESILVAQLSSQVEKKPQDAVSEDFKKQQEPLLSELEGMLKNRPADPQRMMELVRQLGVAEAADVARFEKQKEARREAAIRLSYLQGDDAVRAKVRWILADREDGSNDDTGSVMLNGLAHSRNLQLQIELLQAAWVDSQRVPTGVLQSALQQTKAFLQNETFELYDSHGVPGRMLPHKEVVEEYNRELGEIVATLPQRASPNRERTAYYLLMSGHGLNKVDAAIVRAVIAEKFAAMSPSLQSMMLGFRWKELCDPALPAAPEPLKSACSSTQPPPAAEVPAK